VLAIPFDGAMLPGYFLKPDASGTPRPTLLMIGGGDTIVEDLYAYIGPAGLKRGYNVLMVDLPGQGDLPFAGLVMRPDAEVPMRAVVGYALGRPDVDPERLAAYGISGGGYLVPRAATRERRLRACVANSLVLDLTGIWGERLAAADRSLLYRTLLKLPLPQIRSALVLLDTYKWRWGVETLPDLYEVSKAFTLDPGEITCPVLNVVAQQEWEVVGPTRRWAELCRERAPHPRSRLVVTPRDEGADSHAVGSNLSVMSQVVFDWLDELLTGEETAGTAGRHATGTQVPAPTGSGSLERGRQPGEGGERSDGRRPVPGGRARADRRARGADGRRAHDPALPRRDSRHPRRRVRRAQAAPRPVRLEGRARQRPGGPAAFYHRARLNGAARFGRYTEEMEALGA